MSLFNHYCQDEGIFVTEGMHGVFPERSNLDNIETILDVGCGPGGWALDVAQIYPDKRVVGIDISATMIAYAQAQATDQGLSNVSFSVMNALEPFKFAAGTFNLVNARAAASYVVREQWPIFLQNCLRILRPGGILRITEVELVGLTNSLACEKMISWVARMIHANGYGFSPDGSHYGTIPMLGSPSAGGGMREEMQMPRFRGLWSMLTVWGQKRA